METVTLARSAMATRFEIVLHGEDAAALRAAGRNALEEIERIEAQLSIFRQSSEIARVNAQAAREPVRVTPPVFQLLTLAKQLHEDTGGAFDIAIAPLVRCWGFMTGDGAWPDAADLAKARDVAGMQHVLLDESDLSVRFDVEGAMLDLGAIGKGYAVDRTVEILREEGVASALVHGGTSTACTIGTPPGESAWKVAIESPPGTTQPWLATVLLRDEALSVSAVWGKSFEHDGRRLGHVIDPREGAPVSNAVLSAVVLPSATETDALSTALLVAGKEGFDVITRLRPQMRTLLVGPVESGYPVTSRGIDAKARERIEKGSENG